MGFYDFRLALTRPQNVLFTLFWVFRLSDSPPLGVKTFSLRSWAFLCSSCPSPLPPARASWGLLGPPGAYCVGGSPGGSPRGFPEGVLGRIPFVNVRLYLFGGPETMLDRSGLNNADEHNRSKSNRLAGIRATSISRLGGMPPCGSPGILFFSPCLEPFLD